MNRYALFGVVAILALWAVVCVLGVIDSLLLPSPLRVGQEVAAFFASRDSCVDLGATVYRTLLGFVGSVVIGVPLGVVFGRFSKLYALFEVPIDFLRSLPATALFPLFMLFFGMGDKAKLLLVVSWCSVVTLVYTSYGVRNCPKIKVMAAKAMGLSRAALLFRVILPQALPEIASGLRITLSIVLILVVVLEMFTGSELGLGKRIYDNQLMFRIPEMYAAIMITGLVGYLMNRLFVAAERRFVHWAGR